MDVIAQGLKEALVLVLSLDPDIMEITLLSLGVSLSALLISGILGIPAGTLLALKRIPMPQVVIEYHLYSDGAATGAGRTDHLSFSK